ncbi:MAG TPA: membrane protein insertase YidC [Candidatus Coproplasma stercoravium]|nr:membrane protein insertase YidC [Candidatus Coproplasma stercoravium]
MNLLANISDGFISFMVKQIESIDLNWIGDIIKWLIEGVGITAVGIIIFTLVLKTIVMPLDVFSKFKTKKQSLIMERMRPQMEKLQKQYANDKNMYNQKVMELYKKNGYSMLGICLPTIVSLVIFMVVFSQFSTYSQYANLELYRGMVDAYNGVAANYVYDDSDSGSDGFLIESTDSDGEVVYRVDFDRFETYYNAHMTAEIDDSYEDYIAGYDSDGDGQLTENDMFRAVKNYMAGFARQAAADYYHAEKQGFIWVGNIWYPDSMLNREVPSFDNFVSSLSRASNLSNYEESYNEVTAYLTAEKEAYNGYFVLIVLAIGMMFLSQFVTMRMQKGMNELGTVDGSGKRTNKWLLILMPIIYGIFSFFYSAAFSIYMVVNTTYSFLTTIIVNKALDRKFKKLEERQELDRYLHKSVKTDKGRKAKRR